MKNSGKIFENRIEKIMLSTHMFSDNVFNPDKSFLNVYNYSEFKKIYPDFETVVSNDINQIFLFKNYPLFNGLDESIEFCIKTTYNDVISDCYIENKFNDVGGTVYQKLYHYFQQHSETHGNNSNSFMVLVYDGKQFNDDTKTKTHVENIRESHINFSFKHLILNVEDFNVFLKKLEASNDMKTVFAEMKNEGY